MCEKRKKTKEELLIESLEPHEYLPLAVTLDICLICYKPRAHPLHAVKPEKFIF